jgi:hypothetical protein
MQGGGVTVAVWCCAQVSRCDGQGSCWYRSQRGRVSAEDVLRVLVNFSQSVFFQLRCGSREAVGRLVCWDITCLFVCLFVYSLSTCNLKVMVLVQKC